MNEYFECRNCSQVVQGWNASQMVTCCNHPDYYRLSDEEVKSGGGYVGEGVAEDEAFRCEVDRIRHDYVAINSFQTGGGGIAVRYGPRPGPGNRDGATFVATIYSDDRGVVEEITYPNSR